jgi:hypothetical protein
VHIAADCFAVFLPSESLNDLFIPIQLSLQNTQAALLFGVMHTSW